MRGEKSSVGATFQGVHQPHTDWTINRLFNSSMLAGYTPSDVYGFWNRREILTPSSISHSPKPVVYTPHKSPLPHVVSRGQGGWGHVPQSDLGIVENRQKLDKLREGVKRRC